MADFGCKDYSEELGLFLGGIGELEDLGVGKWYDKSSSFRNVQVKEIL